MWLTSSGFIVDLPHNVGERRNRGIDGNLSYSYRVGRFGTLSAGFNGTWVDKYIVNDGLNPAYDCAGFYGATCGNPLPTWRHKLRIGLQMPDGIGISGQWRYVGKVKHERNSTDEVLDGAPPLLSARRSSELLRSGEHVHGWRSLQFPPGREQHLRQESAAVHQLGRFVRGGVL